MTQIVKSEYGTYLTPGEIEYRKQLIAIQICCPVTNEILSVLNGEVMFVKGNDILISNNGMKKLIEIFGEKFITERIIYYD